MTTPTKGGRGSLPKGDVTPYAYLVKWVTRGQKSQKIGDIIYGRTVPKTKTKPLLPPVKQKQLLFFSRIFISKMKCQKNINILSII